MRSLIGAGVVVALALATGCTFVSQGELERKRACIDVDGDGAPQDAGGGLVCEEDLESAELDTIEVDCDEGSEFRAPHFEEIPYDGIDNDCDENEQDILDIDGDTYPGITRADYEALGGMAWPDGMQDTLDCDDENDAIFPGSPFEVPYDGIDSDCGADEDYDVDGDGYIPTLNPNTGLAHDPLYNGLLPDGDCDDNDIDANPGTVAIDVPYDGIDINCDCVNDYDADDDDYMWDRDANEVAFNTFVARYDCTFAVTPEWGDCDDNEGLVYPGATDAFYDGVDSDCVGDDDYDSDGDGYIPDGYTLVYTGTLPEGDCDDDNVLVYPSALELLGDTVDQDCDGGDNSSLFAYAEAEWVGPRGPRVGWTGEHYVLAVGAQQWTDYSTGSAQIQDWPGLLFRFPPDSANDGVVDVDNTTEIEDRQTWNGVGGQDDPLGEVIDMVTDDVASRVYIAVSMRRTVASGDNTYLALRGFFWTGSLYSALSPVLQSVASSDLANDVDIQIADTGAVFAGSCGTPHLQYIHAGWGTGTFARVSVGATSSAGGSGCVLDLSPTVDADAQLMVQGTITTDPKPYLLKDTTQALFVDQDPAGDQIDPFNGMNLGLVNQDGALTSAYNTIGDVTTVTGPGVNETVFTNLLVHDIAAALAPDGDLYIIAVTEDRGSDGLNDLVLRYGTPGGTFTEVELAVDEHAATLEAHGASIHVDDDRVFLAVSMHDTATGTPVDDVGWMFLGFAP